MQLLIVAVAVGGAGSAGGGSGGVGGGGGGRGSGGGGSIFETILYSQTIDFLVFRCVLASL